MSWFNPLTWARQAEAKDISFDELVRQMWTHTVASGEDVTPKNAMRCTTVHAIVRALTNAIGSYPVRVVEAQEDDDGYETTRPMPTHPLNAVLKNPNRYMTGTQYWRRAMTHVALWGNHFSLKGSGQNGQIQFLNPIAPSRVQLNTEQSTEFSPQYDITTARGTLTVSYARVLHITGGISIDGPMAESPVELAAEAIGLALAAERLLAELYGNGSIPGFLLTGAKFNSEEQYRVWVENFRSVYGAGRGGRGSVAMLPDGMDAKEITFKPIDAQLLEARSFQRTEIASVWGVPPHKLADLERATFSNIEHQDLEFVRDAMLPYVRSFEESMTRDLLSPEDRNAGLVVRFDLDAAVRGDFKNRVDGYNKMWNVGAMNANEIRAREGMNPREGGDEYYTPLNTRSNGEPDEDAATDDDEVGNSDPESDAAAG